MLKVLRKNAPVKKRYIRANEAPFMNKVREKEIMKWWQHKNVFLKKKKKRTLESQVPYDKERAIVPAFYGEKNGTILKILTLQKIRTIIYSGKLWNVCFTVAIFENFQVRLLYSKTIRVMSSVLGMYPLMKLLKKIKRLDVKKACQDTDVTTKIIKSNGNMFADFLFVDLNNSITSSVFPSNQENAKISPVHRKNSKNKTQVRTS